jgi:Protein of unknown function (DUF3298).
MQQEHLTYNIQAVDSESFLGETKILTCHIEYFVFYDETTINPLLNQLSIQNALDKETEIMATLYVEACNAFFEGSNALPYNYNTEIVVTMNQDNLFGCYLNEYIYTGGAHGNLIRSSYNYDLYNCSIISLNTFFVKENSYQCILERIINQIKNSKEVEIYFNDYTSLITKYFNPEQFYLTPNGIVIYYSLYDIAPYYMGIPMFLIPYGVCY